MGRKTYVPRWLHARKVIPSGSYNISLIDSELFSNHDLWPMQLHWLSVTGQANLEAEAGDYDFDAAAGGVGRRLLFEIGISQKSDIAINYAYTGALMCHNERIVQWQGPFDFGPVVKFPKPIILPPDSGIAVEVQSNLQEEVDPGIYRVINPGLVVNGYRLDQVGGREPVQLGGFEPSEYGSPLYAGSLMSLHNADFFNGGDSPIYMTEMMMTAGQAIFGYGVDALVHTLPEMDRVSWRVNPTSGPQWMPNPEPIPAGNLAPFNRALNDTYDAAPRAYVFPNGVLLKPRQRVSLKIGNLSTTKDQTIDICLFGLLEVE